MDPNYGPHYLQLYLKPGVILERCVYMRTICVPLEFVFHIIILQVQLAGSSDAPVEDPNPFKGMHAAVYRYLANSTQSWRLEEALTKKEALHLYTIGSAYGCWQEDNLGKLLPGYYCDFVVVPTVLWESSDFDLCRPSEVWIGGERRFASTSTAKL